MHDPGQVLELSRKRWYVSQVFNHDILKAISGDAMRWADTVYSASLNSTASRHVIFGVPFIQSVVTYVRLDKPRRNFKVILAVLYSPLVLLIDFHSLSLASCTVSSWMDLHHHHWLYFIWVMQRWNLCSETVKNEKKMVSIPGEAIKVRLTSSDRLLWVLGSSHFPPKSVEGSGTKGIISDHVYRYLTMYKMPPHQDKGRETRMKRSSFQYSLEGDMRDWRSLGDQTKHTKFLFERQIETVVVSAIYILSLRNTKMVRSRYYSHYCLGRVKKIRYTFLVVMSPQGRQFMPKIPRKRLPITLPWTNVSTVEEWTLLKNVERSCLGASAGYSCAYNLFTDDLDENLEVSDDTMLAR